MLGSKSSTYVYNPFKIKSVRRVMLYIRYQQMFLSYDYVNKKEEFYTTIINSCLLYVMLKNLQQISYPPAMRVSITNAHAWLIYRSWNVEL